MNVPAPPPAVPFRACEWSLRRLLRACRIAPARHGAWMVLGTPPPGDDGAPAGVSPRIGRVLTYVDRRLAEPLRIGDLADVAGLSRYHFSRVFREEVGRTPWAHVRHARVRRAKRLLRAGRTPAEAAHEAGFADQSHLTRTLRALDGRTPGALRTARGDAAEDDDGENRTIVQDP